MLHGEKLVSSMRRLTQGNNAGITDNLAEEKKISDPITWLRGREWECVPAQPCANGLQVCISISVCECDTTFIGDVLRAAIIPPYSNLSWPSVTLKCCR